VCTPTEPCACSPATTRAIVFGEDRTVTDAEGLYHIELRSGIGAPQSAAVMPAHGEGAAQQAPSIR
jgi:hypothetical protein